MVRGGAVGVGRQGRGKVGRVVGEGEQTRRAAEI